MSLQGIFEIKRFVNGVNTGTEEFQNLITDDGLGLLATGVSMNQLRIGKGVTTPTTSSTGVTGIDFGEYGTLQLANYTASQVNDPTGPYIEHIYHATMEAGYVINGWTELSVGLFNGTTFTSLNHALVKDAQGATAVINKLRDEVIEITYRLRIYAIVNPVTVGTITLGGTTHTIKCTGAQTKSAVKLDGTQANPKNFITHVAADIANTPMGWGDVDGAVALADYNVVKPDYETDSYTHHVDVTFVAPVNEERTIGRIRVDHPFGAMNYFFTPAITLPSRQILQLGLDYVWAEGTNNG